MHSARYQFFPGTSFPQNQHSRICAGHHFDLIQGPPQHRAFTHDLFKMMFSFDFALKVNFFLRQFFLLLRFCLGFPAISTAIPGILTPNEAAENAAASDLGPLPSEAVAAVLEINRTRQFFVPAAKAP